ncbi:OmpA family protein [Yeosuana marina]|uniref:OmpA family protein n=1 Tax=Yeosuana marina TaxID=1565536 RepID=UPI0030C7E633
MKKLTNILLILSFLVFNTVFSQKGKIYTAVKNYEKLSYAESKEQLLYLVNNGDVSFEVIEKLANAYYFNSEMADASKWYKQLIETNPDVDSENYFRYAQALKAQGNYEEANKVFQNFAKRSPNDSRAKEFLKDTNYLNVIDKLSDDFELNNLDVNTIFSDFGTSTYKNHLVFASSRDDDGNIYNWNQQPFLDLFTLNSDGSVTKIKGDINTKYHESSTSFTKDGNTVYFTRNNFFKGKFKKNSNNTHTLKIYRAKLVDGNWTNIESLPFNSDNYSVAHPALSVDERKLYFASDMPGTLGSSDIFVVDINDDGTYGTPLNLGSKINTEGRENFPFVSENSTLYFSSDGHVGLGGLDVFKIKIDDINKSGTIRNMGKPINSSTDDFAFNINETSRSGYISSNRAGGKGDDDIYSFNIPECFKTISGIVRNRETQDSLAFADITVFNENNSIIKTLKSDKYGKFDFSLDCKIQSNNVKVSKDKYFDETFALNIKTDLKEDINLQLALQPSVPPIGTDLLKLLNLNPIYFDFDEAKIRPDAELELAKIIDYLKEYSSLKVDVRSHTDSRGDDNYNIDLSKSRSKSTIEYIVNQGGISSDRVTGEGYGETQLTNNCSNDVKCSREQHQANRRSEFIIIEN